MPWKRRGGTLFFYRGIRVGRRVRSLYEGSGPIAELAAEILEHKRMARRGLREADLEDFREEQRSLGFDDYFRRVEDLARAAMTAAGFHRHKRSE